MFEQIYRMLDGLKNEVIYVENKLAHAMSVAYATVKPGEIVPVMSGKLAKWLHNGGQRLVEAESLILHGPTHPNQSTVSSEPPAPGTEAETDPNTNVDPGLDHQANLTETADVNKTPLDPGPPLSPVDTETPKAETAKTEDSATDASTKDAVKVEDPKTDDSKAAPKKTGK
jgi:hypothetical protein